MKFLKIVFALYIKNIFDSKKNVSSYGKEKSYPTMNVFVADTFNMKFTYILHR
jgi:hypothetical protein